MTAHDVMIFAVGTLVGCYAPALIAWLMTRGETKRVRLDDLLAAPRTPIPQPRERD